MSGLILDGYCGAGGWDEGARMLGLGPVVGVDNWMDACRTGMAAGHPRICADVSTYPTAPFVGRVAGLVMSPPCQAFSAAGKRLGDTDRILVHGLVDRIARGDDDWSGLGWADPRSHHTAQPVRWVRDLRPEWVCLEQVPEVLPLWRHVGRVFTGWGYSVWVGCLNAADYGVPQTRERAILIASMGRPVSPPAATHAEAPCEDVLFGPGLRPWRSMAEALGWAGTLVTTQNSLLGRGVTRRYTRDTDRPAPTLMCNSDRWRLSVGAPTILCSRSTNLAWTFGADSVRVSLAEAAVLQGFRLDYPWRGTKTAQWQQVGNAVPPPLAAAVLGAATGVAVPQPAVRAA